MAVYLQVSAALSLTTLSLSAQICLTHVTGLYFMFPAGCKRLGGDTWERMRSEHAVGLNFSPLLGFI